MKLPFLCEFQRKTKETKGVTDLILWHRKLFSIAGLYPTDPRGLKSHIFIAYTVIHIFLVISDFELTIGRFAAMIDNLREMTILWNAFSKLLMVRYSRSLPRLIHECVVKENDYKNDEEQKMYMSVVKTGVRFSKIIVFLSLTTNITHNLKGVQEYLIDELGGRTPVFKLSYHTHRYVNITDIRTFFLLTFYQLPLIYLFTINSVTTTFLAAFIYHLSGQLSVLAFRIRNIKVAPKTMDNSIDQEFSDIIRKHSKIIRTCETINRAFNKFLLFDLIVYTVLQAVVMYNVILNSRFSDVFVLLKFVLYVLALLVIPYNYCLSGEYLIHESQNFCNAWYECEWYNMSHRCKTLVVICMTRATIPLQLSGGGFYIYCLESFTGIIKSAMAYVSMLRQLV